MSHTQLYALMYAPSSPPRCSTTNVAAGVPSGSGSSSGSIAYAAFSTSGAIPAGSALT
ncbi:hypothetical protein ACFC4G_02715 [Streptomyces sp. NPDC056002]|uniref:hypothetical protein n=1 Tax=Streptomyces sp. NPDC056002 TaxID=3345675 RepID=UPI0035DE6451